MYWNHMRGLSLTVRILTVGVMCCFLDKHLIVTLPAKQNLVVYVTGNVNHKYKFSGNNFFDGSNILSNFGVAIIMHLVKSPFIIIYIAPIFFYNITKKS